MNLPLSRLSIRLPTVQDQSWIRFACREKIDWLGVSFVRTPQDIDRLRKFIGPSSVCPSLIAKIEKREALQNLGEIAARADGLMVARGDLGVETPLETIPLAQKKIITEGLHQGKPVITATQMLESMVEHSTPTRAEVTDVANAVLDGTDAVMLSAETAIGAHPVEAVSVLNRVIREAETSYPFELLWERFAREAWKEPEDSIGWAACRLSHDLQAAAIVVSPTAKLSTARLSRFRPRSTIFSAARQPRPGDSENLLWNVRPLAIAKDARLDAILDLLVRRRHIHRSNLVVVITASPEGVRKTSDRVGVVRI